MGIHLQQRGSVLNTAPSRWIPIVAALLVGPVLAVLVLKFGVWSLGVAAAILVLPGVVRKPFRLYIWLIATWPVLSLYLRMDLPGGVPDLSYDRVMIPLIAVLVILPALILRNELSGLRLWVLIYIAATVVSYASGIMGRAVAEPNLVILLNSLVLPIIMYWLTKTLITSQRDLRWLLYALIVGSLLICATGLYERALDLKESPFPVTTGTASGERYGGVAGGRAAGVMGNPAIYGAVVGMGALASLCCSAHSKRKWGKLLWAIAAIILSYGVLVSFTRSAWVAYLGAIVVTQFMIKGLSRWTIVTASVALVLGGFILFSGSDLLVDSQVVQERVLDRDNVTGRFDRLLFSWDTFLQRPLLGWGPGGLDALMGQKYPEQGFNTSHNTYLTLLVDGGILLFLSYCGLIAFWISQAYGTLRLSSAGSFERSALGVMVGAILIYLLSGLALELRFFGYFNALFWMAGAAIEKLRDMVQENRRLPVIRIGDAWLAR